MKLNHTCPNCGGYKIAKNTWCCKCAKKLDPRYIAWNQKSNKKYQQTKDYRMALEKYRASDKWKNVYKIQKKKHRKFSALYWALIDFWEYKKYLLRKEHAQAFRENQKLNRLLKLWDKLELIKEKIKEVYGK